MFQRLGFVALLLSVLVSSTAVAAVRHEETAGTVSLRNEELQLTVDLGQCRYSLTSSDGQTVVQNAHLAIGLSRRGRNPQASRSAKVTAHTIDPVEDRLGKGKQLTLSAKDEAGVCTRIYTFTIYEAQPFVVMGFGLINHSDKPQRLYWAGSAVDAEVLPGATLDDPRTLNGGAGDAPTVVKEGVDNRDMNSMMLTAKVGGQRKTIVAGGLTHYDFMKEAGFSRHGSKTILTLLSHDPVGRMVDPGTTYLSADKVYLDCITADPFEALEDYALRMRAANAITLNYFDFPTFCGWAMSMRHLGGVGGWYNDSKALAKIAKDAHADGFTRYTPIAVRLEPDTYLDRTKDNSSSQGWYDDEHFRRYKKLVNPHRTFKQWADELKAVGAIPFSYVQVNMPDPAFAKAHPEWLIHGHEKALKPGVRYGKYPPYRWDCTDKGFQKYMVGVWKRWGEAGLVGIKHDYPHTNWFTDGGFDDPHATCVSTYKKWFELCRKGLGPKALIHERNLGRNKGVINGQFMPVLDTCIGINDLQRVSKDNSHIEPEFITKIGLRWYKNRVVMNYYPDCKTMHKRSADERQTILTLLTVISGRLELATPYSHWTPEIKRDLSRVFPVLTTPKSPRPVDMLIKHAPEVYVYDVDPTWSHVIFFNTDNGKKPARRITAPLSGDQADTGSVGLKADAEYYVYDFWGDRLVGRVKGTDRISAELAPCRCAIYTVRQVLERPQVLSTDRHILQGQFELSDVRWDAAAGTLSGKAEVIGNDPMTITFACNGRTPSSAKTDKGTARIASYDPETGLCRVELEVTENATVQWMLAF